MRFRESRMNPLEGGLNVNAIVTDDAGRTYLKRYPKEATATLKSIAHEYHAIGFTNSGGLVRSRTPEEQGRFLQQAAQKGLKVLPPAYMDSKGITYYRFLEGAETLDQFLSHATDREFHEILYTLFADLRMAHSNNILYGDRWPKNILIVPNKTTKRRDGHTSHSLVHIDFDLEISGPTSREFELAQVVYYVVCAGHQRSLSILPQLLVIDTSIPGFDFHAFADYLEKHAKFFSNDKEYGDAENDISILLAAVSTLRGSR